MRKKAKPDTVSVAYTTKNNKKLFNDTPGFSLNIMSAPVHVLSSNNGLVLCSDTLIFQTNYHVCNPLTKIRVTIPPPHSAGLQWARVGFLCKAIANFDSSFVIVRVANYGEGSKPSVAKSEIYSSETGQWAEYDIDDYWRESERGMFSIRGGISRFGMSCSELNAIVCNGLLHWRGFRCVFVFDPDNNNNSNNNRLVKLPDKQHEKVHDRYLGESKGNLMYIAFKRLTFTLWKLNDYDNYGEWRRLHKIRLERIVFRPPSHRDFLVGKRVDMSFLAFDPLDKDVVYLCVPLRVFSFNMCERTIKTVGRVASHIYFLDYSMPYPFVLPWWPLHVPNNLGLTC